MKKLMLLLSAVIGGILTAARAEEPSVPSLCTAREEVLFSCRAESAKVISVCASRDASATSGSLRYLYGRPGSIPEFAYPTSLAHPTDAFRWSQGCSAKGCSDRLQFSIGAFLYTVYSDHYGGVTEPAEDAGVFVWRDGTEVGHIRCAEPRAPTGMYLIGEPAMPTYAKMAHYVGLPNHEFGGDYVGP